MIKMILFVVLWMNALTHKRRTYQAYSPREIIMDRTFDYTKHFRVQFETYAVTHDYAPLTNTIS